MEDNSLLMIVLAFVLGYMCSGMMKQMCGGRLVEGGLGDFIEGGLDDVHDGLQDGYDDVQDLKYDVHDGMMKGACNADSLYTAVRNQGTPCDHSNNDTTGHNAACHPDEVCLLDGQCSKLC